MTRSDDLEVAEDSELLDEQIDVVVSQLRRICRQATMEYALNVGRIVIHNFYGGDLKAWRTRGAKQTSFRKLARRPDLPMSPVLLYRCVATYELCERISGISQWNHINASHIRAVLSLSNEDQFEMLARANAKRWTVRELEDHVLERREKLEPRARNLSSKVARSVRALGKVLETTLGAEWLDEAQSNQQSVEAVRNAIHDARRVLEQLDSALGLATEQPNDSESSSSSRQSETRFKALTVSAISEVERFR